MGTSCKGKMLGLPPPMEHAHPRTELALPMSGSWLAGAALAIGFASTRPYAVHCNAETYEIEKGCYFTASDRVWHFCRQNSADIFE
jgi:hypothetical protein